jgi:hypothetical protein
MHTTSSSIRGMVMATIAATALVHAGDDSTGGNNAAVAMTQQIVGVKDEALAAQEAKLRDHPEAAQGQL